MGYPDEMDNYRGEYDDDGYCIYVEDYYYDCYGCDYNIDGECEFPMRFLTFRFFFRDYRERILWLKSKIFIKIKLRFLIIIGFLKKKLRNKK